MRLGKVLCIGPQGQQVEVEATGEQGLWIDRNFIAEKGVIDIRDYDLPKHEVTAGTTFDRCVASVPSSWALFFDWEHTEPPKP